MIIKRYLAREVMTALGGIVIVLLLAFLSQQVVRYLNYVAIGKIPTDVLIELVSFEIPYLLALLMPLCLYLGILLTYGRLHADNEMAIMQLGGFGQEKVLRLTSLIAMAAALFVLVLMLWVNPWISAKRQQVMTSDEATLHLIQTMIPGRFQVSPDGKHVMYVEKLSLDRSRAHNIFLAEEKKSQDTPDQPQWMLVIADQGYQMTDKKTSDPYFVTLDGYRYEGVPGQNDYKIIQYKKYAVRLPQTDAHAIHTQVETLSTSELLSNYQNPGNAAELQWRFSMGIATFLLAILAVPMSTLRPRQGRYLILLPAIIIYILYINLMFVARRWIEQSFVPVGVGMWWVHGIILMLFISMIMYEKRKWSGFKS